MSTRAVADALYSILPHRCPFFFPHSHSLFFFNTKLSSKKKYPSLDLTLRRAPVLISLHESIRQGILLHSLFFIWKCTVDLTLVLNEIPLLGL
jgi:hypothetical protein